jgi:4-hydroxy-2-oxoheptanedioate aldolase
MRSSQVRTLLAGGGTAVNGWLSNDSAYLAEALSYAGFDAITVDLQHGMFGLEGAVRLIQAISAGPAEPFARCSSHDPAVIGKLLDAGAYGIICPSIDTPEQAADFVAACRYPPIGKRSFGPGRGLLYGGPDYPERADETVMTWAMIESRAALDAVAEIAAVPGLDGLFVGPNDLALSLGLRPGLTPPAPASRRAWERICEVAHAAGLYAGTFCADGATAARLTRLGYDLVTPGNDVAQLLAGTAAAISAARADPDAAGAEPTGFTTVVPPGSGY